MGAADAFEIERLVEARPEDVLALSDLLRDAIDGGAALGFMPPLGPQEAETFWRDVLAQAATGARVVLVARTVNDGKIVGTVQIGLSPWPNGRHRAEVMKMMVHSSVRRRGLGRALLAAIDREAAALGRTLLVLDTRRGDGAEDMYRAHGYEVVGVIPRYAHDAKGMHDTVVFYRHLDKTP